MRPRLRVCKRGHDLNETRMLRRNGWSAGCVECKRITTAAYDKRSWRGRGETMPKQEASTYRLPFAPLEQRLIARGVVLSEAFNGWSLKRWRTEGIPILSADAVCVRFGWHPVQIYGWDFYQ